MSCENAITVSAVSKKFELYDNPSDQLKQFVFPRVRRFFGRHGRNYFREFWALSEVSLEVRKGESFGIVGRNGSGKSTLLQIIAGTLTPSSGCVETNGRLAALLELGSGFDPEFSGRENIYLNGALLGLQKSEIDERFDAIAGFADIGQHLDQPVKSYSSGMVVRLAVAVQTQVEPDILIVDEALAVGDALFQKRCFRRIEQLLDDGCSLLFVSHDQETVRTLTSRSIFLENGRVASYGRTSDVLFSYREYLQKVEESEFRELQRINNAASVKQTPAKSYGNLDVEIISVQVTDSTGVEQSTFYAGDDLHIRIECVAHVAAKNLNVAFRIRNKEGVKVTTWGTLNEDMPKSLEHDSDVFWLREFGSGESFTVCFSGPCSLSANLYEVQAVVALEYDRYYGNQRILHWIDEAAHFSVVLRNREYVFDGVCDMGLRSSVVE